MAAGFGTVIGSGFHITGELLSDESVLMLGSVAGRVSVRETLVVDVQATLEADLEARVVDIAGAVAGNVAASERIEIRNDGRVNGNVRAPRITIADGAIFRGGVEMER